MINVQIFKTKSIQEVLDEVKDKVRKKPQDADLRAYLFQLFSLQGNWAKAVEQIKLSAEMNTQAQPLALVYVGAINAESQREQVLQGKERPAIFGEAEEWMALLMAALEEQDKEKAAMLRQQALEMAPEVAGSLTLFSDENKTFEWICDGDSRLGPICEFINNGRYGWIPFTLIEKIRFIQAQGLSDLVWAQVELFLLDGRTLVGLIPVRYVPLVSYTEQDDQANLSHRTEWVLLSEDHYQGIGQKMLITDEGDVALLDIKEMVFNHPSDA